MFAILYVVLDLFFSSRIFYNFNYRKLYKDNSFQSLTRQHLRSITNHGTTQESNQRCLNQCCRLWAGSQESQDGMCGIAERGQELTVQLVDRAECSCRELSLLYD